MKYRCLILSVALTGLSLIVNAQKNRIIYPKATFNKAEAERMIASDGKASIKGQMTQKSNYMHNVVTLYPCTEYFMEWYELKKKDKKEKKSIFMSEEANSYRILTLINKQDGSFEFTGLNPGKYFLHTTVYQTKVANVKKQVGTETVTTTNGLGIQISSYDRPIMENGRELYQTVEDHTTIVELTGSGQVLNVNL
ncbi:hypothetical protein [Chitinophaga sp.]|uniref:hypothetical protein n=1 Tax=Chitinophaga sp. TaxID=1869181 RepID=UPI002F9294E3